MTKGFGFMSRRFAAALATFVVALTLTACGGGEAGNIASFTEMTCPSGTSPTLAGNCMANVNTTLKAGTAAVPQDGIWWNPAESGRGYVVEVQGDTLALGAYMYATSGQPEWYTGALQKGADGSYSGTLIRYAGGQTYTSSYKAPTQSSPVASALLSASNAQNASLALTVNGTTSIVPIQKFIFGSGSSTASFQGGMWWNPSESGRGFVIEAQGSKVAMSSYMYDGNGNPTWYLTVSDLASPSSFSGEMEVYTGGQSLGGAYKAPTKAEGPGTLRFVATSSTTATLTLPGGKSDPQVISLERFYFGKTELTWFTPPVKVSVTPMGQKVYNASEIPSSVTGVGSPAWQQLVQNGTTKPVDTGLIMTGYSTRPILFMYYKRVVANIMTYCTRPVYKDDGSAVGSSTHTGVGCNTEEISWVQGTATGIIRYATARNQCFQLTWNQATLNFDDKLVTCP